MVLFLCFGTAKAFKAFGIEFHTIAHQQVAEDYLGQRQLMGAVQAWVAEVKCR